MLHRPPRVATLLVLGVALLLGACASGGAGPAGDETTPRAARRGSTRNHVIHGELQSVSQANLFDALRAIRPHWFNAGPAPTGGTGGMGLPVVFVEVHPHVSLESLRSISTSVVLEARYLLVSEAQGRYGTRVDTPVIEVSLTRGR